MVSIGVHARVMPWKVWWSCCGCQESQGWTLQTFAWLMDDWWTSLYSPCIDIIDKSTLTPPLIRLTRLIRDCTFLYQFTFQANLLHSSSFTACCFTVEVHPLRTRVGHYFEGNGFRDPLFVTHASHAHHASSCHILPQLFFMSCLICCLFLYTCSVFRIHHNTQAMGFAARSVLVFFFVWLAWV